jgi:hypothetical protein
MSQSYLLDRADSLRFYDARPTSRYSNYTWGRITGGNNSTPIGAKLPLDDSFARWIFGPDATGVLLYANFYSATEIQQASTLVHELLHDLAISHEIMVSKFSSFGMEGVSDISAWIERGCKKKD